MGFDSRKKSGNIIGGSKLNVDGQGIYNVKIIKPNIIKILPKTPQDRYGIPPPPTPSITPTNTPTPTPTPTFPICGFQLNSVNNISGTTWQYNFISAPQCGTLSIQYSTDSINWVTSAGGCTSPRFFDIGNQTDTIYFRAIQTCTLGGPTTSNIVSYTFPTPTPTPTNTVTPTITPTITPTSSPLPPTIEYFKECCFGSITYKVGGVTTPITVGNTYYITTDEFTFCGIASNEEPYDNQSLVVSVSSYTSCVLCISDNPCPSPTPTVTPTITPTNTLTPTPTQTPCVPQTIYSGESFVGLFNQFDTSFNSDGTLLYISRHNNGQGGGAADRIAGYTLNTAWDVSTISSSTPSVTGNLPINQLGPISQSASTVATGHYFSPDGTKLYVCCYAPYTSPLSEFFITKYDLSAAWNIQTQTFTPGNTYHIGFYDVLGASSYIDFSPDGLFMFIQFGTSLKRYTLTTPWDISLGVSETQSIITINSWGISFQNNGYYLFSLVLSSVQKQTLSSPYDLSAITLTETVDLTGVIPLGSFPSINFKDGYKFFVSKYGNYNDVNPDFRNNIYALNLTCEFDISGPTIVIP